MLRPRLMSEILKGNTFAPNVESNLPRAVVFKDTSNSTLDNSAFIVRSVAKATTATVPTKFTWISIKESSISVNIVPKPSPRHKIEIITILFILDNTASHVICVARDLTRRVNLRSITRVICENKDFSSCYMLLYLNSRF